MALPERSRIQLLAPVVRGRKGEHAKLLEQAKRSGYVRVRIDGSMCELSEDIRLEKNIKHNIEIVVDRLIVKPGIEQRLTDSMENVLHLANGLVLVEVTAGSSRWACSALARAFPAGLRDQYRGDRAAQLSFNNPFGACPDCYGLGYKMEFDIDLMIPDRLSIQDGDRCDRDGSPVRTKRVLPARFWMPWQRKYQFDLATPFQELPQSVQRYADSRHGRSGSEGVLQRAARRRYL